MVGPSLELIFSQRISGILYSGSVELRSRQERFLRSHSRVHAPGDFKSHTSRRRWDASAGTESSLVSCRSGHAFPSAADFSLLSVIGSKVMLLEGPPPETTRATRHSSLWLAVLPQFCERGFCLHAHLLRLISFLLLSARLQLEKASDIPVNLTLFRRESGGTLGKQVASSGPYSDQTSGVVVPMTQLEPGIYMVVASTYSPGILASFKLRFYATGPIDLTSV